MSATEEITPTSVSTEAVAESRGKSRSGKEKKKRRRSKQKESAGTEPQYYDQEFNPFGEDDGENSCSSTPKYERSEELNYPAGGSLCALCYCGPKSLLGQGDLTRYGSTPGFNPFKKPPLRTRGSREVLYGSSPGSNGSQDGYNTGEKVTKTAAVQRRGSKQMRESVKPVYKQPDYVDELSTVGCSEMLDVSQVFEPTGHVTAHHCCAAWSEGVTQNENYNLLCVDKAVHSGMSQRCHSCSRYGATIKCRAPKCERLFHYPCAAGSGCYQDIKSMSLLCADHLELAPTIADPDEINCAVCDDPGQISDLLFCTSCGHHYHGDCLDPHVDVNPVVRAGWQCPECKICQTCRQPGDDNKMLVCDVCDKGYHTFCLRPAMTFIPKNGWCCKNCRRCTDCGSRTPGNGPSSRWHINYQVCDSCYQLRNKGSSCPICGRAYRNISSARVEMTQCTGCKKWVHWSCEEASHLEACKNSEEDYTCLRCRNPSPPVEEEAGPYPAEVPLVELKAVPLLPQPEDSDLSSALSMPPPSEVGPVKPIDEQMEENVTDPQTGIELAASTPNQSATEQTTVAAARKRASTSSSVGSEKGNFALKGSSNDPMLCLGEDNSSDVGDINSLAKSNLGSPPRKVRHVSSDGTLSGRERVDRHSSAESNISSIFTDDTQDAISLFGVEALPSSGSKTAAIQTPTSLGSPEAKAYRIPTNFASPTQPKVTLTPLDSPGSYDGSPPLKPPGPGMGKPGGMFGKGKPFGHKRRPGGPRSRGKGKGKGHKRGGWSGPRKRPRGGFAGKGGSPTSYGDRSLGIAGSRGFPRRTRGRFPRASPTAPPIAEQGPVSPITKTEPMLQIPQADDEYGDSMHNTVVLCSTEDTFTLSQDMCVVCGSFGKGPEGRLIACSQCGQCYHPFCVNLKLTKVVLRKGWRCLDCTVCEECGQVDDPAHLLLCDDCDISYHTHCLSPPLLHVPKGGWKCKWCVRCVHCGTTSPGTNCEWASNYTSCGPCASLTHCPRCRRSYKDEDVIMQCGTCERWLHAICECLFTETDIEKVLEKGYDCCFCRPKEAIPPHLSLGTQRTSEDMYGGQSGVYMGRTRSEVESVKEYQKDCTSLTISGFQHIQRQMQKYMGLYKKRTPGARRRGQKLGDIKRKPGPQTLAILPPPALREVPSSLGGVPSVKMEVKRESQNVGDEMMKGEPTEFPHPPLIPRSDPALNIPGDMSSATATATEDSGMEGNINEMGIIPEGLKSPADESFEMKRNKIEEELMMGGSGSMDPTKAVLGVQQGELKKRRKPYRPGIGGFTVRQRGRGSGLMKPRSRRGLKHHGILLDNKSGTNDTKSDTMASETTSDGTVPQVPLHTPYDMPGHTTGGDLMSNQRPVGSDPFAPPSMFLPGATSSVVSPLKLKISTQPTAPKTSTRRKKRAKLIDQFPPYLQDAFFGKKIIAEAKTKVSPLDNLDEKPASPGSRYGLKQFSDSCLILPDRITQRLEVQAAAHSAMLASASSHGDRSQRHPSQPQDDDAILMDRESEQELLGVLPDLPFKDEEILGIFSSDLKPEQGASDSHENILSPSSLEKMVTDGLAHIDGSDMADLFSDVLNHQPDGTTKQDNLSLGHGDNLSTNQEERHSETMATNHQTPPSNRATESKTVNASSSHISTTVQSTVKEQHATDQHRQLMIQQELQQLQQQQHYQQNQQQILQQHMVQQGHGQQSFNQTNQNMSRGPGINQVRHILGQNVNQGTPGIGMANQHIDPSLPRSHHVTPVMSPVPNLPGQQQTHALGHMPTHSPLPTPPHQTQFMRQTSLPVGMLTGMHTPTGQGEGLNMQQIQQHLQGQLQQGMGMPHESQTSSAKGGVVRQQTPLPGPQDVRGIQPTTVAQSPFSEEAPVTVTVGQVEPHFHSVVPSSTQMQQGPPFQIQGSRGPMGGDIPKLQQQLSMPGRMTSHTPEVYIPGPIQQQPSPIHTPPQHLTPNKLTPAPVTTPSQRDSPMLPQSSNVTAGTPPMQPTQAQSLIPTDPASNSSPTKVASSSANPARSGDDVLVPTQLPDFSSDSNLFEPSPRPWPLGTELEGDCLSVNQRNILKWEKDEPLGELATISPVLYANVKYKDLKKEFPDWPARAKQVAKLWRKASSDERAPFLLKARDNRALLKANRTRRGEESSSKTPTPPMYGEEMETKPSIPMVSSAQESSAQQDSQMHTQIAQVQKLLQELEQASNQDQLQIKTEPLISTSQQSTGLPLAITSDNAMKSDMQATLSSSPPNTQHSFARPKSRESTPKTAIDETSSSAQPDASANVKQPPTTVPATECPDNTVQLQQSTMSQGGPLKLVEAKIERHHSVDATQSNFPYPQSKTPSLGPGTHDSPSKSLGPAPVSRSLSVGAQLTDGSHGRSVTPRSGMVDLNSAMEKSRRLSVDSQVIGMVSPTNIDVKPQIPMSPTPAQIRQTLYHQTTQRSSRRARLWEQQSQPPPPYPSNVVSSLPGTTQTGPGFIYSPAIGPRHQMMQIQGPRMGLLTRGPPPGMMAFQIEGASPHGFPMNQPRPTFPAGVHPVKDYKGQHPPGAYIELRHSNQSDPATRRQNILRIGNVCSSASVQGQPQSELTPEKSESTENKTTQGEIKAPETSTVTTTTPGDAKPEDPFMGGHMPQDEHLDAILRSDEFKHLHFQGDMTSSSVTSSSTSSSQDSSKMKVSTSVTGATAEGSVKTVTLTKPTDVDVLGKSREEEPKSKKSEDEPSAITESADVAVLEKSREEVKRKKSEDEPSTITEIASGTTESVTLVSADAVNVSLASGTRESVTSAKATSVSVTSASDSTMSMTSASVASSCVTSEIVTSTSGDTKDGQSVSESSVKVTDTSLQTSVPSTTAGDCQEQSQGPKEEKRLVEKEVSKTETSQVEHKTGKIEDKDATEKEKASGVLKNDHSYFKSVKETQDKDTEATKPVELVKSSKPGLVVDISRDSGTNLRGVGLTPPPETEVATFVPPEESGLQRASPTVLTVSNVITVPGTPPADDKPLVTDKDKSEAEVIEKESIPSKNKEEIEKKDDKEQAVKTSNDAISKSEKPKSSSRTAAKIDLQLPTEVVPLPYDRSKSPASEPDRWNVEPLPKSPITPPLVWKPDNYRDNISEPPRSPIMMETEDVKTSSRDLEDEKLEMDGKKRTDPVNLRKLAHQELVTKSILDKKVTDDSAVGGKSEEESTEPDVGENEMKKTEESTPEITTKLESGNETNIETTISVDTKEKESNVTKIETSIPEKEDEAPLEKSESDSNVEITKKDEEVKPSTEALQPETPADTDSAINEEKQVPVGEVEKEDCVSVTSSVTTTALIPTSSASQSMETTPKEAGPAESVERLGTPTQILLEPVTEEKVETNTQSDMITDKDSATIVSSTDTVPVASIPCTGTTVPVTSMPCTSTTVPVASMPCTSNTVSSDPQPAMSTSTTASAASLGLPSQSEPVLEQSQPSQEQQAAGAASLPTSQTSPTDQPAPVDPPADLTPNSTQGTSPTSTVSTSVSQVHAPLNKDEASKVITTPPRQKPLLIKEQPLLLQELLEEEKREQDRARLEKLRHTQTLIQQQPPGVTGMYPVAGVDIEKVTPESGIDNIKMQFLSRMNQAAQAGLTVVPPGVPPESTVAPQGTSPLQSPPGHWHQHIAGPPLQQTAAQGFGNDAELLKYRNWLIQHQQLLQIQVPKQEKLVQTKKLRKQALMKKRNQCKRSGKEFAAEDAEELKVVTKQYTEAQQQLEKMRNDQKQHAELVQEFNIKQQRMMGLMQSGTPAGPGTLVGQPQPQMTPGLDNQTQQQMIAQTVAPSIQQPQQHIIAQPFQTQEMLTAGTNMPQQQLIMMQQGQQQQMILKNVQASGPIVSGSPSSSSIPTSAIGMQQQQPQVVMSTQQQQLQQQALFQFQKMRGISPNTPSQIQQFMFNQHQLQQQQLQQKQNAQQQQQMQTSMKVPQNRPQFVPPPQSVPQAPPTHQTVPVTPNSGNQVHSAFMQMQMQQLMALQIEQQQQLQAMQQQNVTEKPKPKRKRKKKKSQQEKEAEEQHKMLLLQKQQQQQQMQTSMQGNLPITNQQHPGGMWFHRPMGPQMQPPMRPQMMMQHQQQEFNIRHGQMPVRMQQDMSNMVQGSTLPNQNRFIRPGFSPMTPTSHPSVPTTPVSSQPHMIPQSLHTMAPSLPATQAITTHPQQVLGQSLSVAKNIPSGMPSVGLSFPNSQANVPMTTIAAENISSTSPTKLTTSVSSSTVQSTAASITSPAVINSTNMPVTPSLPGTIANQEIASVASIEHYQSTGFSKMAQNVPGGMMNIKTEPTSQQPATMYASVPTGVNMSSQQTIKYESIPSVNQSVQLPHAMQNAAPTTIISSTPPNIGMGIPIPSSSTERLSPRIHSPGQSMANFEGLSEAEIAILMTHDPDLNKEEEPGTPSAAILSTSTPPPFMAVDQEDKSPKDEIKKKKRLKRGYVMDKKAVDSIDDCINTVVRLSVEYENSLQAAKGQVTPSPWKLDAKPTKFPPKKPEVSHFNMTDMHGGDHGKNGNKELLKHLLKTGQQQQSDHIPGMFGQMVPVYGMPGMMQPGMPDMTQYNQMQQDQFKMMEVMPPYQMKQHPSVDMDSAMGQKKKRSRRGSKEVGPDGKPIKRRRRKDKGVTHPPSFPAGNPGDASGMPGTVMMPVMGAPVLEPGAMGPMVPFPGGIVTSRPISAGGPMAPSQNAGPEIGKTWKPLPLLSLVEPDIRKTHHMCVPKGTGLTECQRLLHGKIGHSAYKGIPDFYQILLDLDKTPVDLPHPPTPPTSLPPSPTHKQHQQYSQTTPMIAGTETTPSDATGKYIAVDQGQKYGPLGLTPTGEGGTLHRPQPPHVKVPESLPTPPHQGIEDKDETSSIRSTDDMIVPPSSPEMDEEDEWTTPALTLLRSDRPGKDKMISPYNRTDKGNEDTIRDTMSPGLPIVGYPKIKVPTDVGKRRGPLNDKDSVSVTIEFDNANIKHIEKSLTLLSRILDTSIISYSMVEMIKPDRKMKDVLTQAIKDEHMQAQMQATAPNQPKVTTAETEGLPRQRRCVSCNAVVSGNGVRKPQFDASSHEEDVIFCNKECYIKCELIEKRLMPVPVKKKFKASHIYQRHTCKINMATLLEKYPDDDPLTPSKSSRLGLDTIHIPAQESLRGVGSERGGRGRGRRRGMGPGEESRVSAKRWRGLRWKKWSVTVTVVKASTKPPVDVDALLAKYGSALKPPPELMDKRSCVFCGSRGDGDTHTVARLLNVDVDRWVHLNCALWSAEVYETQGGALINVDLALRRSESVLCGLCQRQGATIHCHRPRCVNTYHCQCALDIKCVFFKDKTVLCPSHAPKPGASVASGFGLPHHHSGDTLRSLAVFRKVYVQRPETKQIASIMQQGELSQGEKNYMLRVGALIFENVGQLATHQMELCHSKTAIYPIGYKATRIYWSPTNMRRRCRYECTVKEVDGKSSFCMGYKTALTGKNKPDRIQTHSDEITWIEGKEVNCLWLQILNPVEKLRSQHNVLKLFPKYINGEKLFGLTTPVVSRILESLPNIELCAEYKFRYGRTPLLEVPLAINPTGCSRSEPHIKQHRKKPHTLISNLISEYYESSGIGDASSLYGKQFVHSKSSQYRKMKLEWRSNVYLARSRIQGLGLFSARDIEPGTMVIEYIGDIIRIEVSEKREKMYEATNRGVYMFRLDSDHIVDATVTGGPARYINHSCKPNCVAEVVNFEKEKKIMIVSNRHILKGEELSYDYKFDFEDEGRKIPCLCGASNCKKWMN